MNSAQTPQNEPPADYQKWVHELKREDAQRAHDKADAFVTHVNEAAISNANLALRTSVLINGGAAVSVLAFVGGLVTQKRIISLEEISGALELFAIGVAMATAAMGFSYLTNYFIASGVGRRARIWEYPWTTATKASVWLQRAGLIFQAITIILGFGWSLSLWRGC